jgi:hypothetical protein
MRLASPSLVPSGQHAQSDSARQQLSPSVDEIYHGAFLDHAGKGLSIPIGQPHAPM